MRGLCPLTHEQSLPPFDSFHFCWVFRGTSNKHSLISSERLRASAMLLYDWVSTLYDLMDSGSQE